VLSHDTVLPWENESEYCTRLDGLVFEHQPQGPTEEHLSSGTGRHHLAQAAADKRTFNRQRSTKPCTTSVSFCLPLEYRYRLTADELCWRIEKRRKDDQWRPVEYHTILAPAVSSLSGRLLRTLGCALLSPDALVAVQNVSRTFTLALAPHLHVERQP
jgi:hypothetical protein